MIVEKKTDKNRTKTFSSKRVRLLQSLPKERYNEFKKILLKTYSKKQLKEVNFNYFREYPYIKEILKTQGWETKEIKRYYDYMFMMKDRERYFLPKKNKVKRSYTKDQIDKIKTLNKNKKGKTFDRSGKVIDKVRVFQGGSTGLGKNK